MTRHRQLWRQTLQSRLCDGDPNVLMELYDETVAVVYSSALRLTGSPDRARVVSRETYVHVWTHPEALADCRIPVGLRMVLIANRLAGADARPVGADRSGRHRRLASSVS